nr:hypothetical protein [Tanacetum cinerariifolium]
SELLAKFQAQEEEIVKLKDRVKVLENKEDVDVTQFGDDAPIKGMSINEGEAVAERISCKRARRATKKDNIRMNEQIARDAEVARIYAEEEIQGMTDSLDKSNET